VTTSFARLAGVLDAAALDEAITGWLRAILDESTGQVEGPGAPPRGAIAVDGKTVRGAINQHGKQPHLLAALDHDSGLILAQRAVDGKSNEITAFAPLLDTLDVTGVVITADAMHTPRDHALYLHKRGAYYALCVKGNQPTLYEHLLQLHWDTAPVRHLDTRRTRGRRETRTLKILLADKGVDFPHATQVFAIERRITTREGTRVEIAVGVTNLPVCHTRADRLASLVKDHWKIEAFHYVRDVTFGEDASRIRTGNAPQVMASIRNLVIALLRLLGWRNLAAATQHMTANPHDTLQLIGLT
jgi:predicted transposase YbfD/YdcC